MGADLSSTADVINKVPDDPSKLTGLERSRYFANVFKIETVPERKTYRTEEGDKVGKLMITSKPFNWGKSKALYCWCVCDCNNIIRVSRHSLRYGKKTQCFSCAQEERNKKPPSRYRARWLANQLHSAYPQRLADGRFAFQVATGPGKYETHAFETYEEVRKAKQRSTREMIEKMVNGEYGQWIRNYEWPKGSFRKKNRPC